MNKRKKVEPKIKLTKDCALIIVDVQNDFMPGGALPVPQGDKVVPILNKYIEKFERKKLRIAATRDWHPENHISFRENGGMWPKHCVKETEGAEFHKDLRLPKNTIIISKATEPQKEAYSGFQGTNLAEVLRKENIKRLFIGGLATDYCVKNTILDATENKFKAYFLQDASKGVNVNPKDSEDTEKEMLKKGAVKITLDEIQ